MTLHELNDCILLECDLNKISRPLIMIEGDSLKMKDKELTAIIDAVLLPISDNISIVRKMEGGIGWAFLYI